MCNFYGYKTDKETYIYLRKVERQFGTDYALDLLRSGFEYADAPVIIAKGNDDWEMKMMHWEFIPNWVNSLREMDMIRKGIDPKTGKRKVDAKTGKPTPIIPWLNAKGENLISSPMWKDAARNRRCLIPATHFFEWRWYKPTGEKKEISYPYYITTQDTGEDTFVMAGIFNTWVDRETGEQMDTFAIVTADANSKMRQIHNKKNRQPTILPKDLAERWLWDKLSDQEITEIATYQWPSEKMQAHTIAKDFKFASNPIEHYHYAELPELL